MSSLYKKLIIKEIREESKGVKTFTFAEIPGEEIKYKAGQYLTLVLPEQRPEVRRSYSITSAPVLEEPLTIGVKRIQNGIFSRRLVDHAKVGDEVLTIGAAGFFTLPDNLENFGQVFFLAAGSGITPIFSLLKTVLFAHPQLQVVLIYSNSSPEKTMFKIELEELQKQFKDRLVIEFLNSNAPNLAKARLYKELLQDFLNKYAQVPRAQMLSFICGPENYMRMCMYALREEGVPLQNIKKEIFNTVKKVPALVPPDTKEHTVTLHLAGKSYVFKTRYPTTILQAARQAGISLPYSCETGRCGNCAARCTRGKTWMRYNEVLTDKQIEAGFVLTCVAFPVEGDVELNIL